MTFLTVLAFLVFQDEPVTKDITVAGQAYGGDPIQIFADDLAKDGGNIVVRGSIDPKGFTGTFTVEVSTDAGLTWNKATGQDPWSYSFRPMGNASFRIATRVVKEAAVPLPKVTIENLAFSIEGQAVKPGLGGEIAYTGRITVTGTVRGTANKISLGYEVDGAPTAIFQNQDIVGSKDFSVELPNFAGQTKTVRIGVVFGTSLLDYKSFVCVPAEHDASKKIKIRRARFEEAGAYLRFEAYNPAKDGIPLYNVPMKVRGTNGAENTSTLPELPANEWTDVLILLGECYGPIDLEISSSKFASVVDRQMPKVDVVPAIVLVRAGDIWFYVFRHKDATLDKLWGTAKLYLGRKIDGFDQAPFDRDLVFGSETRTIKVNKGGHVIGGQVTVTFDEPQEFIRAGEIKAFLKTITLSASGCKLVGHVESQWSMTTIPFATKEVKDLYEFYTANSGIEINLLGGQIRGKVNRMDVDFSDKWSPAGLEPTFRGIYFAKENITFTPGPQTQIWKVNKASIEKFMLATYGLGGTINLSFESARTGPFDIRSVGTLSIGQGRMGEVQATSAELGMPDWMVRAGMPAWFPINTQGPLYNLRGQIDLLTEHKGGPFTLKFGEATVEFSSFKIDLSETRSLAGDSQDHSWQGLWIEDATVTFKGHKVKMPFHIDTEMNGEFILAENTQTHAGLKFNIKATEVKVIGQGNFSTQSADVIMELPAGIGINNARSVKLTGIAPFFAGGKPEFVQAIPGDFAVRCPGFAGKFKDLILDLSSTEQRVGTKASDKGLHLPPGKAVMMTYFGGGEVPCGAFTINENGLSGSYKFQGVTYIPGDWKGLSIAVKTAEARIEKSDLKDIKMTGTLSIKSPVLPSTATITLDTAVFDYANQKPEFTATGSFAKDTKVPLDAGMVLLNPAKLYMKFDTSTAVMSIDTVQVQLPAALGKGVVALKKVEIAKDGIKGTYLVEGGPTFTSLSGVAGTKLTPSAMSFLFDRNRLMSGRVSGKLEFTIGSTPFSGKIKDVALHRNPANTVYGMVIDDLDMQGQPFTLGGIEYSVSSVAVDLSDLANLAGITGAGTWKGVRIISGTMRVPLKIKSKQGSPVSFVLKGATFPFGGQFSGTFPLVPVSLDLLNPSGFGLSLTKGTLEVVDGKPAKSQIEGTLRLPATITSESGAPVSLALPAVQIGGDGNLYCTGVTVPKLRVGAYIVSGTSVTVDLSMSRSPQGKGPDWMGVDIDDAKVIAPFLSNLSMTGTDFYIDPSGVSGSAAGKEGTATFAGFALKVAKSQLAIKNSKVSSGQVDGTLTTKSLLLPSVGVVLKLGDGGVSSGVGAANQTVPYGLVGAMSLSAVTVYAQGNGGHVMLAGTFTPTIPNLKAESLSFTNLMITHEGKVTLANGWVSLDKPKTIEAFGFDLQVEKFGMGDGWFGFSGTLQIGKTFSGVMTKCEYLKIHLKSDGSYDKFTFSKINVDIEMAVVNIKGAIEFVEDKRGKGFAGSVELNLRKAKIDFQGAFYYGDNGSFDFVQVDVSVIKEAGKPLGSTGLALYGIKGGFAWNMAINPTDGSFKPSKGTWVFSAGVIIGTVKGKGFLLNGDMILSISNQGDVALHGDVWFLCRMTDRSDSRKIGGFSIVLSSSGVSGSAWMSFSAAGVISISGTLEFKVSSGECYVRIGSETNPITSTLCGVLSSKSYIECREYAITIGSAASFDLPGIDLGIVRAWFNAGYSAKLTLVTDGPSVVRVWIMYLPARYPQISGSFSVWGSGGAEIVTPDSLPNIPLASIGFSGTASFSGPNPLKVSGSIYFYVSTWFYSGGFNASFSKEF